MTSSKRSPRARHMRFVTMENGCIVAISHALHSSGYLVKTWGWGEGHEKEGFHRFIYRAQHGLETIPKGWEVDHECGNRACCNPRHLRLLSRAEHLDITNRLRFSETNELARQRWEAEGKPGGSALGRIIGRGQVTCSRWIRRWVAEDAAWEVEKAARASG